MIKELYFKPDSCVASCRSLSGASKLVSFMQERFGTGRSKYRVPYKFHTAIETCGKISVYCNYCFDEHVKREFKGAIADFLRKHSHISVPVTA